MAEEDIDVGELFAANWQGSPSIVNCWRRAAPAVCLEGFGRDDDLGGWITGEIYCSQPPILSETIVEIVLQRIDEGSLGRGEVIDLALAKLKSPIRQGLEKGWVAFWKERLRPTDAERLACLEAIEELVLAPGPFAARLGIEEMSRSFDGGPEEAPRLPRLELLGAALEHGTQAVGKAAWKLLRRVAKGHPEAAPRLDELAVRVLSGPHKSLRKEVARWLARRPLDDEILRRLGESSSWLEPEVREILGALASDTAAAESEPRSDGSPAWSRRRLEELLREARREESHETTRAIDRHRIRRLESWLAAGELIDDFAPSPHEAGPPFEPLDSAESMARLMLEATRRHYSRAEIEQLLDGAVRFAEPAEAPALLRMLSPLQRLDDPFISQAIARWLAMIWLEHDGEPQRRAVPDLVRRRLEGLARRPAGELLATPTHASGWLDPRVLIRRYLAAPAESLCLAELEAALDRLWTSPEARAEAWELLASGRSSSAPSPAPASEDVPAGDPERVAIEALAELALAVALLPEEPAPDDRARKEARRKEAVLERAARELIETASRDVEKVLQAALRARVGLGDLDAFVDSLGLDAATAEQVTVILRLPSAAASEHRPTEVSELVYDMPSMAQRSFEAAFRWSIGDAVDYSRRTSFSRRIFLLLEVARLPHVQVAEELDGLATILTSRHALNRDALLDLLVPWLEDGRISPTGAAVALAALARSTSKGAAYLLEALEQFSTTGPWAALVVQGALEQVVVDGLDQLPPRLRGQWLDLLARLLEELARPFERAAVERLDSISSGRGAVASRARRLLESCRALPAPELPWALEVEAELLASGA